MFITDKTLRTVTIHLSSREIHIMSAILSEIQDIDLNADELAEDYNLEPTDVWKFAEELGKKLSDLPDSDDDEWECVRGKRRRRTKK